MRWPARRVAGLLVLALGASGAASADPVLGGDPIDPSTGRAAVIVPGAPWVRPGPDGVLGSDDDVIDPDTIGDIDLVVRVGAVDPTAPIPAPQQGAAAIAVAEPFREGTPITVSVLAVDGSEPAPGRAVAPAYWEGLPVLVLAFPDLDGDGIVGITHLDGDPSDAALEERELEPVAMRYLTVRGGVATGELWPTVAGPPDAPLRVALAAAAFAGPLHDDYFEAMIPDGPAITTRLPFPPLSDPTAVIQQGLFGLLPAAPEGRMAVLVRRVLTPDPGDPLLGEAFALRLDGSDPTIDVATVVSGAFARPAPLVPSLGEETAYRIRPSAAGPLVAPDWLLVPDDGDVSELRVRVVGLDRLGNVTSSERGEPVRVRTRGPLLIRSPDADGDPHREEIWLEGGSGVELVLDDEGGAYDGEDQARLSLDAPGRPTRLHVLLPDPDLDDDGLVTREDLAVVVECSGFARGDDGYNMHLDLDGDGVVGSRDAAWIEARLGTSADADKRRGRGHLEVRGWKQGKARKPRGVKEFKHLREERPKHKKRKQSKIQKSYCPASSATGGVLTPTPCDVSIRLYKLEDDKIKWELTNNSTFWRATLQTLTLDFPSGIDVIEKVKLDGDIYEAKDSNLVVGSGVTIDDDDWTKSNASKRELEQGETRTLAVEFEDGDENATADDFDLLLTFEEGCDATL